MSAECFPIYWMLCLECRDGFFIVHSNTPLPLLMWFLSREERRAPAVPLHPKQPQPLERSFSFPGCAELQQILSGLTSAFLRWEIRAHFTAQILEGSLQGSGWTPQRITGTLRLGKTSKMIKSNLPPNSTVPSNPNQKGPRPLIYSTLPEMVAPPVPWGACSKAWALFQWGESTIFTPLMANQKLQLLFLCTSLITWVTSFLNQHFGDTSKIQWTQPIPGAHLSIQGMSWAVPGADSDWHQDLQLMRKTWLGARQDDSPIAPSRKIQF